MASPMPRNQVGRLVPRCFISLSCLFLLCSLAGCSSKTSLAKPPRPPAAKVDVTTGVIVQLRLAVEAFDTVFDMRAPEQDLLPMLVHAWATFYGWTDPPADTRARYDFTQRLCRARLPAQPDARDLFRCMNDLREALLKDLVWSTQRYLAAGHPDKVGSYSLVQVVKELRLRLVRFQASKKLRHQRRARRRLFEVARCRLSQPVAPVITAAPRDLSLNGFPVITQTMGSFDNFAKHDLDGLRHQVESRLMESQPAGNQPEQLILAIDQRLAGKPLLRLIDLASGLGVSRVCLKVRRRGRFTVPCCLPVRLSPKVVRPRPALELDAQGLHRVTEKTRRRISTDPASVARALRELGAEKGQGQPPLVLLPGASPSVLVQTVAALPRSTVVELIPAGVTVAPTTAVPRPATTVVPRPATRSPPPQ